MGWDKREAVTNLVVLGDGEENRKKVGGLLTGLPRDKMYPEKVNYEIVEASGEVIVLSGSTSLGRQITEKDIGKFIKCEFGGWGRSGNGRFKIIEVNVWDGELTDAMKQWPRPAGTSTPAPAAAPSPTRVAVGAGSNQEPFPAALEERDDDLPF